MDSVVDYWRPVLFWMVSLQSSLIALGAEILDQARVSFDHTCRRAKYRVEEVFDQMKQKTTYAYQDLQVRAGGVYSDVQRNAGDTYQDVHGKAMTTWQRWWNSFNLQSIQNSLKFNLIINRFRFQMSIFFKDLKNIFSHPFHIHISENIKNLFNVRHDSKIKMTRWKKRVAETAKVSFERLSKRAHEYEDILDGRLQELTPTSNNRITFETPTEPIYEDIIEDDLNEKPKPSNINMREKGHSAEEGDFDEVSGVNHHYEELKIVKRSSSGKTRVVDQQMDESESSGSSQNLEIMRIMSNKEKMALIQTKYVPVGDQPPPLPPPRLGRRSATPTSASAPWTPIAPPRRRRNSVSSCNSNSWDY